MDKGICLHTGLLKKNGFSPKNIQIEGRGCPPLIKKKNDLTSRHSDESIKGLLNDFKFHKFAGLQAVRTESRKRREDGYIFRKERVIERKNTKYHST